MVETILRQFLEHPKRKLIVIIVTAVIGLVLLWPAVDNYLAGAEKRAKLNSEIAEANAKVEQSAQLTEQLAQRLQSLAVVEKEAMSKKNVEVFRDEVAELVRSIGGKNFKTNSQAEATRQTEFSEYESTNGDSAKSGPRYEVVGRTLNLSVKGTQASIVELIDKIQAKNGMVQVQSFSMKQATEDGPEMTTLDLALLLLDLVKPRDLANG